MPKKFTFLDKSRLKNLENAFHELFSGAYRTCLQGGAEEPQYRPAGGADELHTIEFTRDYFSSALHEIAHWCIAGAERLQQLDYGYWYAPDGRNDGQQREFERVEVKPQALERILSFATQQSFSISADNLEAGQGASEAFKHEVHRQTLAYCQHGLPERAVMLVNALAMVFDTPDPRDCQHYSLEALR